MVVTFNSFFYSSLIFYHCPYVYIHVHVQLNILFSFQPYYALQVTNPDGLLRLYLLYDFIPQAVELTIEYIDGVTGLGSQHFGIKVVHV